MYVVLFVHLSYVYTLVKAAQEIEITYDRYYFDNYGKADENENEISKIWEMNLKKTE